MTLNRILFAALLLGEGVAICAWSAQPSISETAEFSAIEGNPRLRAWLESWHETLPGLLVSAFQVQSSEPFPEQGAHRSTLSKGDSLRGCCWTAVVASPDGHHAVGWTPQTQEPHSDVYLIDAGSREAVRVLQCGTTCQYEQVIWLDARHFVIAGAFESSGKGRSNYRPVSYRPTLVLFDLDTNTTTELGGPVVSSRTAMEHARRLRAQQ
jgi:hypothetical protein